jgi:ribose 1,5-bisphosphokinase PhnN
LLTQTRSNGFAKTKMDRHTLDAHGKYKRAVEAFVTHLAAKKTLDEFANTDHYWAIRP